MSLSAAFPRCPLPLVPTPSLVKRVLGLLIKLRYLLSPFVGPQQPPARRVSDMQGSWMLLDYCWRGWWARGEEEQWMARGWGHSPMQLMVALPKEQPQGRAHPLAFIAYDKLPPNWNPTQPCKYPELISAASAVPITIEIHLNENVFAYAGNNMENASPPLCLPCPNIIRAVLDRTWNAKSRGRQQRWKETPLSSLHLLSYSSDS